MSTTVRPVPHPHVVRVQREPKGGWASPESAGVSVTCRSMGAGLAIGVAATGGLSRVHLRWPRDLAPGSRVLGDAWERSYGDLAWRSCSLAERLHPWMALLHSSGGTWATGVDVRAGAFAGWTIDPEGVSLWLDVRAGADPVVLGDRTLHAATVRWVSGEDTFETQCALVSALCTDALPSGPLVGASNSYSGYGRDFTLDMVLHDSRTITELVGAHPVRPFTVVADGWSVDGKADGRSSSGGPWERGRSGGFADMGEVAGRIAAEGVRPGVWFRPLASRVQPAAGALRPWAHGWALDPSHPATLEAVAEDVRRFRNWGFDLIKFDYTSFDALGRWGFQMGPRPAADDVRVHDPRRTTAEVLVGLYRTIRDAAGPGVVLGKNTVGHLAAGLVHAQRVGDDTSGRAWERTRRMGVNALAFRLAQHRRFFAIDADVVMCTPRVPWAEVSQFLDLIARSGTSLFVAIDPALRSKEIAADLSAALRLALDGGTPGGVEPLDWMESTTPQHWRVGGGAITYDWFPEAGADPFDVDELLYAAPRPTLPEG